MSAMVAIPPEERQSVTTHIALGLASSSGRGSCLLERFCDGFGEAMKF